MGALTPSQNALHQSDRAAGTVAQSSQGGSSRRRPLATAFVGLLLFMFVYFARPEDWVPGLSHIPLAKIAGIMALLALAGSLGQFRQRIPLEVYLLILLVAQLFAAALLSPVWRGGAMQMTLGFGKLLLIVPLITAVVTTCRRLRWLIFSQAASLSAIAAIVIWKGRLYGGRLAGIVGGSYDDPNDLALAIVLSLPLCLALLFLSRTWMGKLVWSVSMLAMTYAVFLTGSRGGFLALLVVSSVCLWEFAIRGRRRYLLLLAALAGVVFWQAKGEMLAARFQGTFGDTSDTTAASTSSEVRRQLFWRSIEVTGEHPLFGVGPGNFDQISGLWHTTHNSYTLMSAEGGIPALILYLAILWCGFKNLRAASRLVGARTEPGVLARALYASFAGFVIGSAFLSWGYVFLPYILVAYTTPLVSIARKSVAQSLKESARQAINDADLQTQTPQPEILFAPRYLNS
jgi:putative inorganic carbon (hco3(-)) transporter